LSVTSHNGDITVEDSRRDAGPVDWQPSASDVDRIIKKIKMPDRGLESKPKTPERKMANPSACTEMPVLQRIGREEASALLVPVCVQGRGKKGTKTRNA
jgi:hypothetical protein